MNPLLPSSSFRELLSQGADALATPGATRGVCALLFSPVREEVEILHRRDLALEVCTALADRSGRELLAWARRSPRAHLLRREGVTSRAPALRQAMAAQELGALALFPLLGEDSILGYLALGLAPMPRGVPLAEEMEEKAWTGVLASLRALSLEVGRAVLREILSLRRRGQGTGIQALLVLDGEDRVLFSHATSRIFPSWGRGEIVGQPLKGLPGGRVLAVAEVSQGGHLVWRTRTLSGERRGDTVALGALSLSGLGSGGAPCRLVLMRDPSAADGDWGMPAGGLLLELAVRVSQLEARLEGSLRDGPWDGQEETGALVREALDVAEQEDGEEAVDLSGLFRGFLTRLDGELRDDRIQVLAFLATDLPKVRGDRRVLETAFWSLLRRAWASLLPRGGTITLRTWEEGGSVWCTVSDDGPGSAEEAVLETLSLEPLLRIQGGEDLPGSGVEMARSLIGVGGGAFHMECRPGLWTRYTVVFPGERLVRPVAPALGAGALPPAVEVKRNGNGQLEVLVVDDNDMVRTVLRKYLERKGHAVTEAVDGGVALNMVSERAFDHIMVDIDMPGTTGVEFFERLASVAPDLRDRTIFMTGGFQEGETERYIQETGRPHIQKPFDLREIGQILRT